MRTGTGHGRQQGFTLLEMAVALIVIVLLLGGLLVPLATQIDQQRVAETDRAEAQIVEALTGYTLATGSLPCPDTDGDAAENRNAATLVQDNFPLTGQSTCERTCSASRGTLPSQTLGVPAADAWGSNFRYGVTPAFARLQEVHDAVNCGGNVIGTSSFALGDLGNIQICRSAGCAAGTVLVNQAAAVVVSRGKNQGVCTTSPSPPACADELENVDADQNFVSRTPTPAGSALGEFDDVVTWISPNVLFARMVAAERLP